jgi:hypothetical protein
VAKKKSAGGEPALMPAFELKLPPEKYAILLDASYSQTRHSAAFPRALPPGELFEAQRVALTSLFDRQQTSADGGDYLGLSFHGPTADVRWRKLHQRQCLSPDALLTPADSLHKRSNSRARRRRNGASGRPR